jgi:hypothetical protein
MKLLIYLLIFLISQTSDDDDEADLIINRNQDTENSIKTVAPGQGKPPLPWHMVENIDEFSFPKIFGGHAFDPNKKLSYASRAKTEVLLNDRRSCIPQRVLFLAKRKLEDSIMSQINICMRKKKSNGNISAQSVLQNDMINQICQHNDGFRVLKPIRSDKTNIGKLEKRNY